MKKLLLSILGIMASLTAVQAQQGESIINAQLGIAGSVQGLKLTKAGYASYEYFITDNLTIGGLLGVVGIDSPEPVFSFLEDVDKGPSSNIAIGALLNYHFLTSDKLDPYFGFSVGYASEYTASFLYEFHGGTRYYLSDTIALNGELGVGLSVLKIGISYKL